MKRVTCREIGEKLGLSHSSVSLALRNHASLPLKTRERVQALAKAMGYRPDPALASLNAYRQATRGTRFQSTLAWINSFPNPADHPYPHFRQGAGERAKELGFYVEEFWTPTKEHWKRLPRLLKSRGIEGLLLPPPPGVRDEEGPRSFPWNDFHAIALGESAGTELHMVINNQFQSGALVVRQLFDLGYRKIGMVTPMAFARHTDFLFLGGYLSECARLLLPPLFLLDDSDTERQMKKRTIRWYGKHRPDAIIAAGDGDILPPLNEARLRVPEDVALAYLSRSTAHPQIAGIDQNNYQIGVEGANFLSDLIRRNERGVPALPLRLLVKGLWVKGTSAPPRS